MLHYIILMLHFIDFTKFRTKSSLFKSSTLLYSPTVDDLQLSPNCELHIVIVISSTPSPKTGGDCKSSFRTLSSTSSTFREWSCCISHNSRPPPNKASEERGKQLTFMWLFEFHSLGALSVERSFLQLMKELSKAGSLY